MTELLAPAGNTDALKAAVFNGADAVYLGLGEFNARAKSIDFNAENLSQWVDFCHLYGVKVYITLNTLLKTKEFGEVNKLIAACAAAKADAFIITDLSLVDFCGKSAPNIPLHASTQMGIHNACGAKIAEKLGFSRVILARETLISDIIEIKRTTDLEIEYFVQGALCVAFSGNCLMSSVMSGLSGNRGRCLQPCRQLYSRDIDGASGYFLSTSDQCLLDKLSELQAAGVDSFKIEGRLKRPEYVAETVRQYRAAIDKKPYDKNKLLSIYNRGGFTQGYNFDDTQKIMSPKVQGHLGIPAGKIIACKPLSNCYEIVVSPINHAEIEPNDGYKIISADGLEIAGRAAEGIKRIGQNYVLYNNKPYPVGSVLHITTDASQLEDLKKTERKLPVKIKATAFAEKTFRLELASGNAFAEVFSERPISKAQNRPLLAADIEKQISKLNETPFFIKEISVETDDECFIPVSELNEIRRQGVRALTETLIRSSDNSFVRPAERRLNVLPFSSKKRIFTAVNSAKQLTEKLCRTSVIIVDIDDFKAENVEIIMKKALKYNSSSEILLNLPIIARGKDINTIETVLMRIKGLLSGLCVNNLYGISLCEKFGLRAFGGSGLNIFNRESAEKLGLSEYVISTELNKSEITDFGDGGAMYAFGNLRLMTLTHCPMKLANGNCDSCGYKPNFSYSDDKGTFSLRRLKTAHCYFELRNGFCHNLVPEAVVSGKKLYLDLTDRYDTEEILSALANGSPFSVAKQTRGHFNRGVK